MCFIHSISYLAFFDFCVVCFSCRLIDLVSVRFDCLLAVIIAIHDLCACVMVYVLFHMHFIEHNYELTFVVYKLDAEQSPTLARPADIQAT